jgi:hypothetical protein
MSSPTITKLDLIYHIRVAAGDPTGKLMQPELVNRIAAMREMEIVLRQIADMKRRTREQRLAKACVVFFDAMEDHKA